MSDLASDLLEYMMKNAEVLRLRELLRAAEESVDQALDVLVTEHWLPGSTWEVCTMRGEYILRARGRANHPVEAELRTTLLPHSSACLTKYEIFLSCDDGDWVISGLNTRQALQDLAAEFKLTLTWANLRAELDQARKRREEAEREIEALTKILEGS